MNCNGPMRSELYNRFEGMIGWTACIISFLCQSGKRGMTKCRLIIKLQFLHTLCKLHVISYMEHDRYHGQKLKTT